MDTSHSIPPVAPDLALARTPVPPKQRGNLLRFSLRSLLVMVTLLAMGLAWCALAGREAAGGGGR